MTSEYSPTMRPHPSSTLRRLGHNRAIWRVGCFLGCWFVMGCSADPIPPTVSIVSQAPAQLVVGDDDEDDLSLRLGYEDGDGDLGGGVVHVYDCRDGSATLDLPIGEVASPEIVEEKQPITGELIALIPDISAAPADAAPPPVCTELGAVPSDGELLVCVTIEDAAGQLSDGACSAPFALTGSP